jgi:hypothetical protein
MINANKKDMNPGDIVKIVGLNSKHDGKRFKVLSVDGSMIEVDRGWFVNVLYLQKKVNGKFQ